MALSILLFTIALTTYWGIPSGAWVVIGTIISGFVLKLADKWIRGHTEARDDRKDYRDEIKSLRDEMKEMRGNIDKLEGEVTFWRSEFYKEQDKSARMRRFILDEGKEPPAEPVKA